MSSLHKNAAALDRHVPHNWIVADAAAKTALAGSLVAADLYKTLFQVDTKVGYILSDYVTPVWTQIGGAAANGLPIGGTIGQQLIKQSSTDFDAIWTYPTLPIFSAYQGAAQSIVGGAAAVKLNYDTEDYDVGNYYSTVNKRYTPLLAGYYNFNAVMAVTGGAAMTASSALGIYKNGTEVRRGRQQNSSNYGISVTGLVFLNGSTDYVEIFAFTNNNVTVNTLGANSYFEGYLVKPT